MHVDPQPPKVESAKLPLRKGPWTLADEDLDEADEDDNIPFSTAVSQSSSSQHPQAGAVKAKAVEPESGELSVLREIPE